jgi:single-strand DNA-binding protein
MRDVCKTILIGTVVDAPVTRYLETIGGAVTNLIVESVKTWKDRAGAEKSRASKHMVCVFGKQADMAARLEVGQRVWAECDIVYKPGNTPGTTKTELQAQYLSPWEG